MLDENPNNSYQRFEDMIKNEFANIKSLINVNTIIGDAIDLGNGCKIYPVVKLTFGMVSGGGEYSAKKIRHHQNYPFVGASGAGVTAQPVAFVINNKGDVQLKTIEGQNLNAKVLQKLADALSKYIENLSKNNQKGK
ncbi:MAG: hypothetical protein IJU58_00465 [Clostridia bacterium]|nr:hypothetical protein [Clostridia bacterium]